jgi:hypothetical protein
MDSVACSVRLDCTGLLVAQRQAALRVVRLTGSSHVTVVFSCNGWWKRATKIAQGSKASAEAFLHWKCWRTAFSAAGVATRVAWIIGQVLHHRANRRLHGHCYYCRRHCFPRRQCQIAEPLQR